MQEYRHLGVYAIVNLPGRPAGLVLIRKARGPYRGTWDLPGGSLEFGERPLEALAREVREETGLALAGAELVEAWSHTQAVATGEMHADSPAGRLHHVGLLYRGQVLDGALCTAPDGQDSHGAAWFAVEELGGLALSPLAMRAAELLRVAT